MEYHEKLDPKTSENDQYHNWAAVFYYGHMGMEQIPGTPYYHYAFHEAGEQTAPEPSLIWDEDIYGYTGDNHNFVSFGFVKTETPQETTSLCLMECLTVGLDVIWLTMATATLTLVLIAL